MNKKKHILPRVMIAAAASGSGKTTLTCGLLCLLKRKGYEVRSFKCGPDYIDPMFHTKILGTPSKNLDTFFAAPPLARRLFWDSARLGDLSVVEGVMGFYDGLGGTLFQASSYDVSQVLQTPVILVVNGRGMSRSVVPLIRGFVSYQSPNPIRGVILNQVSPMMYPALKQMIEEEVHISVYGYVPVCSQARFESRHLGLVLPGEIGGIREQVESFADVLADTLDVEGIVSLADQADALEVEEEEEGEMQWGTAKEQEPVRIAIARDEAFCFYYEDSLELYRRLGARLVPFSPLRDQKLPDGISGLLLGGGYPELAARELSANESMRADVRRAVRGGLCCRAECGGFLYLHRELEGEDGSWYPMAGVLPSRAFRTKRLGRFGYLTLEARTSGTFLHAGEQVKAHEFHYWDSEENGDACIARKPVGNRSWDCLIQEGNLLAGFPHLYDASSPWLAKRFVEACRRGQKTGRENKR